MIFEGKLIQHHIAEAIIGLHDIGAHWPFSIVDGKVVEDRSVEARVMRAEARCLEALAKHIYPVYIQQQHPVPASLKQNFATFEPAIEEARKRGSVTRKAYHAFFVMNRFLKSYPEE